MASWKTMPITNYAPEGSMGGNAADPFDPASLRIDATTDTSLGIERPLLAVPVCKPPKQTFFRVHPGTDMCLDMAIIELGAEREIYAVAPNMVPMLPGETRMVRLYACMPRHGGLFLWPVKLPTEGGRDSGWNSSARAAATMAQRQWVRVQANMAMGMYDVTTTAHIPDPVWPDVTMAGMLRLAFGDGRLIDREDHPVVRQLAGLV